MSSLVPPRWINVWETLSLDPSGLSDLMASIQDEYAEVVGVFGLDGD